ncbi:MAG: FKBP-type peptidyl-prolyl cis-trans isomerase [Pedobacter sp.]|nr:FKBP-type peptidyl-prolyl cis-trans isomerase [Pedobacter sp.]MDQ8053548.1 FKBP-type peptidyl-prolyl cis-trans isomerase [Pedobacter sp.]
MKLSLTTLLLLIGIGAMAQTKKAPVKKPVTAAKAVTKPIFRTNLDSASYALGLNVAGSFKSGGLNTLNFDLFNKGLKDAFAKANPALSPEQCQETINNLFVSFNKQREAEEIKKHQPTVKAGAAFMAANKAKAGVKTTPSGLQYEVLVQGAGARPTENDQVTVHYRGTLINGTQFDSSYDRGMPATFGLTQVIKGWTEGLQLMQEGSKFRFVIPYQLGYGGNATPDGKIPPFSTLVFEVELIKVGG